MNTTKLPPVLDSSYKSVSREILTRPKPRSPFHALDVVAADMAVADRLQKKVVKEKYKNTVSIKDLTFKQRCDKAYDTMTPERWLKEARAMATLSLDMPELLELKTGEIIELNEKETRENLKLIQKKRKEIYEARKANNLIKGLTETEFFKEWFSIVEANVIRAVAEIESKKRVLIRGDIANFIVGYLLKNGRRKKQVLYTAYAKSLGLEKWNTETRNKVSSALLRLVSKDYLLEDVTKYNEQYYRANEAIYKAENGKFYFKKG